MDNQLIWKDEYNIGVDIIDNEHQRLFQIINNLLSLGKEKRSRNPQIIQLEKSGNWNILYFQHNISRNNFIHMKQRGGMHTNSCFLFKIG